MAAICKSFFSVIMTIVCGVLNLVPMFSAGGPSPLPVGAERFSYGEKAREVMDIYMPDTEEEKLDVLLVIHGGAWMFGTQTMFANDCMDAAKAGFATVAVDYSMLQDKVNALDMVDEIEASVAKAKEIIEQKGYQTGKMIVAGHSAGAHLSALYGFTRYKTSPIPIAFIVGNATPSNFFDENGSGKTSLEKNRYLLTSFLAGNLVLPFTMKTVQADIDAVSPVANVSAEVPPTILVHGKKDSMVPYSNSVELYEKLQECGVDCALITYENSDHMLMEDAKEMRPVREQVFYEFAERYL